MLIEIGVRVGP